jgi:hypothetical protein
MASLINLQTEEIIVLNSYHQFGRASQNDTCIMSIDVSRNHATICWQNSTWKIIDHSKNGTIVDNRILCQSSRNLKEGNRIQFGGKDSNTWKVLDLKAPCSYLKSTSKKNNYIELSAAILLPSNESPEISLYKNSNASWKLDTGKEIIELQNRNVYRLGNEDWEYIENEILDTTTDLNDISKYACVVFKISADEEAIDVKIVINDFQLDLGERVYNHVLLKLAQEREKFGKALVVSEKQGWMDMNELIGFLSKELLIEVDEYYLNVQIHRLRKRLMDLPPYGYLFSNIIERKNGELRFNHPNFKIVKVEK